MTNLLNKIAVLGLLIPTFYFSQVTTNTAEEQAKIEAKKKAEQEKAALPKPYNEEENAEKKIEELVKQAQKENKNII